MTNADLTTIESTIEKLAFLEATRKHGQDFNYNVEDVHFTPHAQPKELSDLGERELRSKLRGWEKEKKPSIVGRAIGGALVGGPTGALIGSSLAKSRGKGALLGALAGGGAGAGLGALSGHRARKFRENVISELKDELALQQELETKERKRGAIQKHAQPTEEDVIADRAERIRALKAQERAGTGVNINKNLEYLISGRLGPSVVLGGIQGAARGAAGGPIGAVAGIPAGMLGGAVGRGIGTKIETRALLGRMRRGGKGTIGAERRFFEMTGEGRKGGKTYPISRAITSIPGQAVLGGLMGGGAGALIGGLTGDSTGAATGAMIGAPLGAALGAGGGYLSRYIGAHQMRLRQKALARALSEGTAPRGWFSEEERQGIRLRG